MICKISANEHWTKTGFQIEKGTTYRLRAQGTWFDDKIQCGPSGWNIKEVAPDWQWPMFRLVEPLRPLDTGDSWFGLVGKVGDSLFTINDGIELLTHESGELLCCPNDCPFLYWNNTGEIELEIIEL